MMAPRYRDIKNTQVPEILLANGVRMKIIAGKLGEYEGPAKGIIIDPEYLDVTIPVRSEFKHATKNGTHRLCLYNWWARVF